MYISTQMEKSMPTSPTAKLVLRTVYIEPTIDEQLRTMAFDNRTSKNDLIRDFIKLGIKAARTEGVATPKIKITAKKHPIVRVSAAKKPTKKAAARNVAVEAN